MTVKSRVETLEKARPADKREHGRKFTTALVRAYGDGDEPAEPVSDAELAEFEATWEAALEKAYGPGAEHKQVEV